MVVGRHHGASKFASRNHPLTLPTCYLFWALRVPMLFDVTYVFLVAMPCYMLVEVFEEFTLSFLPSPTSFIYLLCTPYLPYLPGLSYSLVSLASLVLLACCLVCVACARNWMPALLALVLTLCCQLIFRKGLPTKLALLPGLS